MAVEEDWVWYRPKHFLKQVPLVSCLAIQVVLHSADPCALSVHCIDRLPDPTSDPESEFSRVAKRAKEELNTSLTYHELDIRNVPELNNIFRGIADERGRLDGCLAAAGINYESPALDYTSEEADRMMSINVSGAFMTAQAAARQMVRLGTPGSICMIASMSGTVANRGMFAP